jgi:hypothetical protein
MGESVETSPETCFNRAESLSGFAGENFPQPGCVWPSATNTFPGLERIADTEIEVAAERPLPYPPAFAVR